MQISIRNLLIGTLFIFFTGATVSYYITRYNTPEKIVTKTEVVEKIVIKEVESKKTASNTKVDKTTTTVKKPDGTITVVEVDKTVEEKSTESTKVTDTNVDKDTKTSSATSFAKDWRVGLKTDLGTKVFEASAGRRILWGIWGEASYNTDTKKPLVGISVEF